MGEAIARELPVDGFLAEHSAVEPELLHTAPLRKGDDTRPRTDTWAATR